MTEERRALIIEDDLDSQIIYRYALKEENFKVDAVSSGLSALKFLKENPVPDLILLDYSMPGMTGQEFMAKLRENPEWDTIRVILVSGWDDIKSKSIQVGADGFIKKPFSKTRLHDELERCY